MPQKILLLSPPPPKRRKSMCLTVLSMPERGFSSSPCPQTNPKHAASTRRHISPKTQQKYKYFPFPVMQASTARALPPRECSPTSSGCCCSHSGAIQSTRQEEKYFKIIFCRIIIIFLGTDRTWRTSPTTPPACQSSPPTTHRTSRRSASASWRRYTTPRAYRYFTHI